MKNVDIRCRVQTAYLDALGDKRGWLDYHLNQAHPTRFGLQIIAALAFCESRQNALGCQFATELAAIPYHPSAIDRARWIAGFEQLIQKLAELIVLRSICSVQWIEPFKITIEPTNVSTGKKPDFVVHEAAKKWLFEVKCPAFHAYQDKRRNNAHQLPVRSFLHELFSDAPDGLTLPRDNVVKDFLASADQKFRDFDGDSTSSILAIVWDSHIYEATSILKHEHSGLLTDKSWFAHNGSVIQFASVDHVIVINRLDDLVCAAQEGVSSLDSEPFVLGGPTSLPSVWCPNVHADELEQRICEPFDAWPFDGTGVAADYALTDYVMWLKPGEIIARHRRTARRSRFLTSASALSLS